MKIIDKMNTKMSRILLQLVSLKNEFIKQAHEGIEERVNGVNNKAEHVNKKETQITINFASSSARTISA